MTKTHVKAIQLVPNDRREDCVVRLYKRELSREERSGGEGGVESRVCGDFTE